MEAVVMLVKISPSYFASIGVKSINETRRALNVSENRATSGQSETFATLDSLVVSGKFS